MIKYRNLLFVLIFLMSKEAASSSAVLSEAFEEATGAGSGAGAGGGGGGSGSAAGCGDRTGVVGAVPANDDDTVGAYYLNPYSHIKEIAEAIGDRYETLHESLEKTAEVIGILLETAIKKLNDEIASGNRQVEAINNDRESVEAASHRLFPNKPDPFTKKELLAMIDPRPLEAHLVVFNDLLSLDSIDNFFRRMLGHLGDYFSHRKASIDRSRGSTVYIIPTRPEDVVKMQTASQYHNLKSVQYTVALLDFKIALLRLALPFTNVEILEEKKNQNTIRCFGLGEWLTYTELPVFPADPDSLVQIGNNRFAEQQKRLRQQKEKGKKNPKGDSVSMVDGTALATKKDAEIWRNLVTPGPKPLPDFSKRTPYIGGKAPNPSAPVIEEIITLFNKDPSVETLSHLKDLLGHSDEVVRDFIIVLLGEEYVQQYIGKGLALFADTKAQVDFMKDINKLVDSKIQANIRAEFRKNSRASSEASASVPLDTTDDGDRAREALEKTRKESEAKEQERKAFAQRILELNQRMGSSSLYLSFRPVLPPVEWMQVGDRGKYPTEPIQLTSGQRRTLQSVSMGNVVSFKDASSLLKRLGFLAVSTDGSHTRFLGPITVTLVKEHEGSEEMGVSRDMLEILKHLSLLDDRGNVTAHVIVRS